MKALASKLDVYSEIPIEHPEKCTIEDGLRDTLGSLRGRWMVRIMCSEDGDWWALGVEGPRFAWTTFLREPSERTAESIAGRVIRALKREKLLD